MSLKDNERDTLIRLYLAKSDETLEDARYNRSQERWNATANRLYYALFHAITALFVSDGIPVHSHNGMKIPCLSAPAERLFYGRKRKSTEIPLRFR